MLFDRRAFRYFDLISFLITVILSCIGLLFIFSATYLPERPYSIFFFKQMYGLIAALVIYFLCLIPDYRTWMRWGYVGYYGVILLLMYTLIKGSIGMGAQRWINLIFFKLQPSELAKLLFPAWTVHYLHIHKNKSEYIFTNFLPILTLLAISFILILKQPDLGTALISASSGLFICWLAGIGKKFFIYGLLITTIAAPFLWRYSLKSYQKKRVLVFLGIGDTKKDRYQREQAMIAIGSGGITGKGLLKGTQNKLRFLPAGRTDFIFAVLCEEWGLLGALIILSLYMILFYRLFFIASQFKDRYMQLFSLGIIIHIIFSSIVNIGMVLGLLPIVGIPLPLMSYGISNLWITFASLGIFQNIAIQRTYYIE